LSGVLRSLEQERDWGYGRKGKTAQDSGRDTQPFSLLRQPALDVLQKDHPMEAFRFG
jgi:hypothetical protein